MKRLFRIFLSVVFILILFLVISPQNNKSFAGAVCTAQGGSCGYTGTTCAAALGRSLGPSDCSTGYICCTFKPDCASPNSCKSSCAAANVDSAHSCAADGTTCCAPAAPACAAYGDPCLAGSDSGSTPCCSAAPKCVNYIKNNPDAWACECPQGETWVSGACAVTGCTAADYPTLCSAAGVQCGSLRVEKCNMTIAECKPPTGCTGGYTCDPATHACTKPTCDSYAPSGGSAGCVASTSVCHQTDGTSTSSLNDCDGATPTCCKWAAEANKGGYDCTSGCQLHFQAGTGTYSDLASCKASGCRGGGSDCAVCPAGFLYDPAATSENQKCYKDNPLSPDRPTLTKPTYQSCSATECVQGSGCGGTLGKGFTLGILPCATTLSSSGQYVTECYTAFGVISTNPQELISTVFKIILSIVGGIAVLLIILSAYKLITSQGNPEKTKDAQEQLTAAIVGLIMIIFTFTFMNFIGVDILNIFKQ